MPGHWDAAPPGECTSIMSFTCSNMDSPISSQRCSSLIRAAPIVFESSSTISASTDAPSRVMMMAEFRLFNSETWPPEILKLDFHHHPSCPDLLASGRPWHRLLVPSITHIQATLHVSAPLYPSSSRFVLAMPHRRSISIYDSPPQRCHVRHRQAAQFAGNHRAPPQGVRGKVR